MTKFGAVAYMNCVFWLLRGYEPEDLEIERDGSVIPVKKKLPKPDEEYDDDEDYGQDMSDDGFSAML